MSGSTCPGNDPLCPCHDGAACHYRDDGRTKGFALPYDWPGEWTRSAPKVEDHLKGAELVWAVRGYPFTRTLVARSNVAVRVPGFAAKAERFVRMELMADGQHGVDASAYPWFADLEWRGPLVLPEMEMDK